MLALRNGPAGGISPLKGYRLHVTGIAIGYLQVGKDSSVRFLIHFTVLLVTHSTEHAKNESVPVSTWA